MSAIDGDAARALHAGQSGLGDPGPIQVRAADRRRPRFRVAPGPVRGRICPIDVPVPGLHRQRRREPSRAVFVRQRGARGQCEKGGEGEGDAAGKPGQIRPQRPPRRARGASCPRPWLDGSPTVSARLGRAAPLSSSRRSAPARRRRARSTAGPGRRRPRSGLAASSPEPMPPEAMIASRSPTRVRTRRTRPRVRGQERGAGEAAGLRGELAGRCQAIARAWSCWRGSGPSRECASTAAIDRLHLTGEHVRGELHEDRPRRAQPLAGVRQGVEECPQLLR